MAEGKGTRLVKRGNWWYIVWPGNSRGRSTRTGDRRAAEVALAAFISDAGEEAEPAELTVADALHHYWIEHACTLPSREQVEINSNYLRAFFGTMPVASLTDDHFKTYIRLRRHGQIKVNDKRSPRPASDGYLRRELGVLSTALHHETRKKNENGRKRLSLDDVPHIPMPEPPPPRDRWLTADEEAALLKACPVEHNGRLTRIYRFLILALDTAARKEAIETLTWFQVDLDARVIRLNPAGRRQTRKRRATVRMSDRLHMVLTRAFAEREGSYVLDHPGNIRRSLETVTAKARLEDVSAHVFRHTWATRAARAGVSMREIADVLGDDIRTVERHYMGHHPDFQKEAVNWRDREADRANIVPNPASVDR